MLRQPRQRPLLHLRTCARAGEAPHEHLAECPFCEVVLCRRLFVAMYHMKAKNIKAHPSCRAVCCREVHIRVHGIDAEDKCNHFPLRMHNQFGDMVSAVSFWRTPLASGDTIVDTSSPPATETIQNAVLVQVHFLTTRDLNLGTLFELFCERMGADLGAVSFMHKVRTRRVLNGSPAQMPST